MNITPESRQWWEGRRLRYNIGLIIAGILAFVCYVIVADRSIEQHKLGDEAEITLFTTFGQGIMYLFAMGIANFCYMLGPWWETRLKPANVDRYRSLTYNLGFWFSVLLPFSISVILVLMYGIR